MIDTYIIAGSKSRTIQASDEDTSNVSFFYYGFITLESSWLIMREDYTGGTGIISYRYASAKNNVGFSSYANAWANRATLTYGYFFQAQL